jgi:hypothetical protein
VASTSRRSTATFSSPAALAVDMHRDGRVPLQTRGARRLALARLPADYRAVLGPRQRRGPAARECLPSYTSPLTRMARRAWWLSGLYSRCEDGGIRTRDPGSEMRSRPA